MANELYIKFLPSHSKELKAGCTMYNRSTKSYFEADDKFLQGYDSLVDTDIFKVDWYICSRIPMYTPLMFNTATNRWLSPPFKYEQYGSMTHKDGFTSKENTMPVLGRLSPNAVTYPGEELNLSQVSPSPWIFVKDKDKWVPSYQVSPGFIDCMVESDTRILAVRVKSSNGEYV